MNNVAAEMEHLHNPGKIEFGTPGARKRARPVWGGLGGNVRQQCHNAPPFHSIIAAARPSKCYVTTGSDTGWLPAGSRRVALNSVGTWNTKGTKRNTKSTKAFFVFWFAPFVFPFNPFSGHERNCVALYLTSSTA
jgi:hypothetical protein